MLRVVDHPLPHGRCIEVNPGAYRGTIPRLWKPQHGNPWRGFCSLSCPSICSSSVSATPKPTVFGRHLHARWQAAVESDIRLFPSLFDVMGSPVKIQQLSGMPVSLKADTTYTCPLTQCRPVLNRRVKFHTLQPEMVIQGAFTVQLLRLVFRGDTCSSPLSCLLGFLPELWPLGMGVIAR